MDRHARLPRARDDSDRQHRDDRGETKWCPEKSGKKVQWQPNQAGVVPVQSGMNSTSIAKGAAQRLTPCLVAVGGLLLLAGCESPTESHVVSAPPPPAPVVTTSSQPVIVQQAPAPTQVVVTSTATAAGAGTIIVTQAPPAVQHEVVLARPSSAHVWIPGYWTWRNNRYEWMGGHWEIPPRTDAVWVGPRTERLSDGTYRFYEGFWD